MMCITLTLVPECARLATLTATLGIMGFFMGTIDTVANISMLQLYGRNVAPFLQVGKSYKDCTYLILSGKIISIELE